MNLELFVRWKQHNAILCQDLLHAAESQALHSSCTVHSTYHNTPRTAACFMCTCIPWRAFPRPRVISEKFVKTYTEPINSVQYIDPWPRGCFHYTRYAPIWKVLHTRTLPVGRYRTVNACTYSIKL